MLCKSEQCWELYAISDFQKPHTFKTRLSAKPWHRAWHRFETEALTNSKMVYCIRLHTTANTILQRPTF